MRPIYKAMLATHEALRRLGFSTDDIYAIWAVGTPGGPHRAATMLRAQNRQFVVEHPLITEDLPPSRDVFVAEWKAASAEYNGWSQPDGEANYRAHYDLVQLFGLSESLKTKGFLVPRGVQ